MRPDLVTARSGIGYPIWRAGSGRPLIVLHGFTGSHATWGHLVPLLAANHQVVTLDLPGHGASTLPPALSWDFESVVDDLAWIIDEQRSGNADILGYSMGGRLALALAATHPDRVRRVILESASPGIADEQERNERQRADERLADRILDGGLDSFVAEWERLPMWQSQTALSEADQARQRQVRLGQTPGGLADSLRATGAGAQPSYWEQLAGLTTPTLLIAGEMDHKFARISASMHEAMPDAQLAIVSNAGHAVHLEQPTAYTERVLQFLNRPGLTTTQMKGRDRD